MQPENLETDKPEFIDFHVVDDGGEDLLAVEVGECLGDTVENAVVHLGRHLEGETVREVYCFFYHSEVLLLLGDYDVLAGEAQVPEF